MKPLVFPLILAVLWCPTPIDAQQVMQRSLDPATSLMLMEIGAIAEAAERGDAITLNTVLPKAVWPEANRSLDLRQGDVVLMMNGQRVRSISKLRELYDGLSEGAEVKLALGRDEQRFLVAFAKGSAEAISGVFGAGGTAVRVVRAGPGGGDVELFHEARVLFGEQDGEVRVLTQLMDDGDLHEGDMLVTVDGKPIATLGDFRQAYGAAAVGDRLHLEIRRGDESHKLEVAKAERPAGMVIR